MSPNLTWLFCDDSLVQQTDRRNAENLAERITGATLRALQRFLTESPWTDQPVIDRLQGYVGRRVRDQLNGFVVDDTGFAKQGVKSVGVARQSSGTLGQVGNCQIGVFLAYVAERGHARWLRRRAGWLFFRRNLDGSALKPYRSNAPAAPPWLTLARVSALRWPVETEFQLEKGKTGRNEYEVRSWQGWHHHITLTLLAGAFLLSLQQEGGEKCPRSPGRNSRGSCAP